MYHRSHSRFLRERKIVSKFKKSASAGNRTRGPTMATLDFTTKPLMLRRKYCHNKIYYIIINTCNKSWNENETMEEIICDFDLCISKVIKFICDQNWHPFMKIHLNED